MSSAVIPLEAIHGYNTFDRYTCQLASPGMVSPCQWIEMPPPETEGKSGGIWLITLIIALDPVSRRIAGLEMPFTKISGRWKQSGAP